jgi:hypothetical protein
MNTSELLSFAKPPIMNDTYLLILGVVAGIAILLFLVLREIFCWYYKINERVDQNKEIIRLLKKIADAQAQKEIVKKEESL